RLSVLARRGYHRGPASQSLVRSRRPPSMQVDILAFGPHPDDAEIGAGAVLRKMKSLGHRTGIIDMTSGDMGWGSPEIRLKEGEEAAEVLQVDGGGGARRGG